MLCTIQFDFSADRRFQRQRVLDQRRRGPYQCGEASAAFLAGANSHEASGNTSQLTQELEAVLKAFGSHLSPFSEERKSTAVGVLTAIFSGGPQPEQKIFDSGIMRSKTF